MAYMNQERKAQLAHGIKAICKKYDVKASLAVNNHSTLVLNIKQGSIDFIGNFNEVCAKIPRPEHLPFRPANDHISVNTFWYHEHFSGTALAFLKEIIPALNVGNHDRSDIQSDYFDVGWYVNVNIGQWNKPYALVK